jgi:hypothetical protein
VLPGDVFALAGVTSRHPFALISGLSRHFSE